MTNKKAIRNFFVCVIILSAIAELLICKYQYMWGYPLLMWMPAVSAVIATIISMKENKESLLLKKINGMIGFRTCKLRYIVAGVLIPLFYLLIPYMIYWHMHPNNFAYSGVKLILILKDCLPVAVIGLFAGLLTATGEEIGWRGFLVPALNKQCGLNKTLLITGLF